MRASRPRRGTRRHGWGRGPHETDRPRGTPSRALVVALVLACATLMVLDRGGDSSPVDPARAALAEVVGPAETAAAAVVRPLTGLPDAFRSRDDMRAELAGLEAENARLRTTVRTSDFDRNRLRELEGLTTTAADLGRTLVPARVVALGPGQSFSSTATIDAGSDAGLAPDMTVVNNDGLVGRVLRVSRSTATVLLLVDPDSTVGGRVADSMQLGFVRGRGTLGDQGRLDLELVDQTSVPRERDTVLTWGSRGSGPYVAGVPVGEVTSVYSSLRESSQRAVVDPFVDFTALDVVGVVVPTGTTSDRSVLRPDGSIE